MGSPLADGVTAATGINNAGDIVGYFTDASNVTHGFIDVGGIYTTIDAPNAFGSTQVLGINDIGDLVGTYVDAKDLTTRGFVASPVPEPDTLALLGVSLAGTVILRRQRSKSGGWRHTPDR